MDSDKRFRIKFQEEAAGGELLIIADTETGVNYLCARAAGQLSLTPLLDEEGKVVIDL